MAGIDPIVRIQSDPFDAAGETKQLCAGNTDVGAIVAFTGLCRDEAGTLSALELEHYPGMAEAELRGIALDAADRWPLAGITIVHRTGRLIPGDPIVLVLTASKHREAAFEAAEFVMDFLKSRAPFWKREHPKDGAVGDWVAADPKDAQARRKWKDSVPRSR